MIADIRECLDGCECLIPAIVEMTMIINDAIDKIKQSQPRSFEGVFLTLCDTQSLKYLVLQVFF
jgi:hypothetical protein